MGAAMKRERKPISIRGTGEFLPGKKCKRWVQCVSPFGRKQNEHNFLRRFACSNSPLRGGASLEIRTPRRWCSLDGERMSKILIWDIESTHLKADWATVLCIGWKWYEDPK